MNRLVAGRLQVLTPDASARIWVGTILGGVALLLAWSFFFRVSLIGEAQSMIHSTFALERDIASLQSSWSSAKVEEVDRQVAELNAHLFDGYGHLGRWLMEVQDRAHQLGLTLNFRVEEATTAATTITPVDKVRIELSLQTPTPQRGYANYLRLIRDLSEFDHFVDVKRATLTGTGQGALAMNLTVQVLMRRET